MNIQASREDIGRDVVEGAHKKQIGSAAFRPVEYAVEKAVEKTLRAVSCEPWSISKGRIVARIVEQGFKAQSAFSDPHEKPVVSEAVGMHPIADESCARILEG